MATKINNIRQSIPTGGVLTSAWLASQNVQRGEQTKYVHSGWLVRLTQGVYQFAGDDALLYMALATYLEQTDCRCHVGASSALDLRGYTHFLALAKPQAFLFTRKEDKLQKWLGARDWNMDIRLVATSVFAEECGIEFFEINGHQLRISSPERAIMECLYLFPKHFALMDTYYVMEMLTALRPKLVSELLQKCTSVKVKRLFLYMAEKANFPWFKALKLDGVDLGSGIRGLVTGGVLNAKYKITIPKELADYE
ncbi:MAG: type IV toxin-antitoxin system AbiEi family antitoxin [Bacteroidaceae bacterium]|nr:type IV toxin-antitoxin system AbiEi family antitoxin [Bacteroidaceae bacterium]